MIMTKYGKDLTTTGKYKANLMGRIYALIIDYELKNGPGSATGSDGKPTKRFLDWLIGRLIALRLIAPIKDAE